MRLTVDCRQAQQYRQKPLLVSGVDFGSIGHEGYMMEIYGTKRFVEVVKPRRQGKTIGLAQTLINDCVCGCHIHSEKTE